MRKHSDSERALIPHSRAEAVHRLMLDQRCVGTTLRTQMWQAHGSVRGEGRIVTDGVFAQIVERIGALVGLLSSHIARRGLLPAQASGASGAHLLLRHYPLGVADEHAHAFAASGALALVAQTARDDARTARALDDPACASLFEHIAASVDAQIWLVQRCLDLPVVTAIFAVYSGPPAETTGDHAAICSGAASAREARGRQHEAAPRSDCRG